MATLDHHYHCPWCGATLSVHRVEFGTELEMECSNPNCEQPSVSFAQPGADSLFDLRF